MNVGAAFPLGESDAYATVGGVLLADGRVLCVPGAASAARIFDPATDSFPTSAAVWPWTRPGEYCLRGGVLLLDGRVFLAPRQIPYCYLYDPAADRLTRMAALTPTSAGPLLFPDGTVLGVRVVTETERDGLGASDGVVIFNSTSGAFEGRAAGVWVGLG